MDPQEATGRISPDTLADDLRLWLSLGQSPGWPALWKLDLYRDVLPDGIKLVEVIEQGAGLSSLELPNSSLYYSEAWQLRQIECTLLRVHGDPNRPVSEEQQRAECEEALAAWHTIYMQAISAVLGSPSKTSSEHVIWQIKQEDAPQVKLWINLQAPFPQGSVRIALTPPRGL